MADSSAFSVRFFINPLISLYQTVFSTLTTFSTRPAYASKWENRFYRLFHYLCFSPDQLTDVMTKLAPYFGAQFIPKHAFPFSSWKTFSAEPTLLLRAIVPSSGFAITFKALIDTGAYCSFIQHDLATLLFNNGATCEYMWPFTSFMPFFKMKTLHYRKINGLTLQSLEDGSVNRTTSILLHENCARSILLTPG